MKFQYPITDRNVVSHTRGFTLIELLVVTGILVLISGLVLANNTRFGGAILLKNMAYDVGLSIREAQVYGTAVRRFGAGDYDTGYGVYFNRSSPTSYVMFADIYPAGSENGLYEAAHGELLQSTTMQRGFHIQDICGTPSGGGAEVCGLNTVSILFQRPEPDAYISVNGNSGIISPGSLYERARIVLESPRDDQVSVIIEATGQIAVE